VAFIGAATAWVAANCTDEMLPELLDAVSQFGYARVAEREIPRAMAHIEKAKPDTMSAELARALNLVRFGANREIDALRSIEEIYTGSQPARTSLANRVRQWEIYREGLAAQVSGYAEVRSDQLGIAAPKPLTLKGAQKNYDDLVARIHANVKGREFSLNSNDKYSKYMEENKEALKDLGLTPQQARTILNFVNGKRSVTEIRNSVAAEMDQDVPIEGVAGYLELLKTFEWIAF
jgi:Holliday junction resolvasome RuvABC DNA-binding subunit